MPRSVSYTEKDKKGLPENVLSLRHIFRTPPLFAFT